MDKQHARAVKVGETIKFEVLKPMGGEYAAGDVVALEVVPGPERSIVHVAMGVNRSPVPLFTLTGRGFIREAVA